MYQYSQQSNELAIINRHGAVSLVTCTFLTFMIFIMGYATLVHAELVVVPLNFIYAFVHLGIYFSILYRLYLINYDYQWHHALTINNNWHTIINVASTTGTSLFVFLHNTNYICFDMDESYFSFFCFVFYRNQRMVH